jgi:spastic paraplegia protein 7
MALGGRVAESVTFNRITTGAENDLQKVTKMAYAQVRVYGMSTSVGLVSFPEDETKEIGKRPYSKRLAALMDEEAHRLVAAAYQKTEQVLKENKVKLELVSDGLRSFLMLYFIFVQTSS